MSLGDLTLCLQETGYIAFMHWRSLRHPTPPHCHCQCQHVMPSPATVAATNLYLAFEREASQIRPFLGSLSEPSGIHQVGSAVLTPHNAFRNMQSLVRKSVFQPIFSHLPWDPIPLRLHWEGGSSITDNRAVKLHECDHWHGKRVGHLLTSFEHIRVLFLCFLFDLDFRQCLVRGRKIAISNMWWQQLKPPILSSWKESKSDSPLFWVNQDWCFVSFIKLAAQCKHLTTLSESCRIW